MKSLTILTNLNRNHICYEVSDNSDLYKYERPELTTKNRLEKEFLFSKKMVNPCM